MDTVSIPRNGGRVVFRSRFADYTGKWIHHCHILMHEDMGMMQEVECVATAAASNPNPKPAVAGHAMTEEQVSGHDGADHVARWPSSCLRRPSRSSRAARRTRRTRPVRASSALAMSSRV
jgi:hypothetical protein